MHPFVHLSYDPACLSNLSTCLKEMRPIRNVEDLGGAIVMEKQSLEAIKRLWNEWEIQCLILASFGLQVFLFFAAGMRRHSVSRVLNSLLWLAYLSADSVAVFVLGHLAANASGSHQLLIFWAPFLLLHLGGQDTITAFSLQDNELWARHLLGLLTQAAVAAYVVSISSWQDRRLLAATVLMFLSGCFKYAERTLCLYIASPTLSKARSLSAMGLYIREEKYRRHDVHHSDMHLPSDFVPEAIKRSLLIGRMLDADMRLPGITSDTVPMLLSDTPLNDEYDFAWILAFVPGLLRSLKSKAERCRAYSYVSARLVRSYESLYTKAWFHTESFGVMIEVPKLIPKFIRIDTGALMELILAVSVCFFPLFSAFITLVLFMFAEKGQLYSRVDITISYILLIGAITLEVASLSMTILSYFASTDSEASCPGLTCVAKYIHPAGLRRKHWSKMLAQYSMIRTYTRQDGMGIIVSILPQWIGKHLHDNTLTRIPITEDLEKFVLDKLLDFGESKHSWNFASFRGQIALRRWPAMHTIINSADLPTSVMIWHIATEICYFGEKSNNSPYQSKITRVSRELSNYIMYLVFKCNVMLTDSTKLLYTETHKKMKKNLGGHSNLGEGDAIRMVFEANKGGCQAANTDNPSSSSSSNNNNNNSSNRRVQLPENNMSILLDNPVLSHACTVAKELQGIEVHCWDLIAAVWLEMLFYIAPRCGGAFHMQHLSTGGEFVTHVLVLMSSLGPFLPTPGT